MGIGSANWLVACAFRECFHVKLMSVNWFVSTTQSRMQNASLSLLHLSFLCHILHANTTTFPCIPAFANKYCGNAKSRRHQLLDGTHIILNTRRLEQHQTVQED